MTKRFTLHVKNLYALKLWQRLAKHYLREHPLCVYCLELGVTRPSEVVDHKVPHEGDRALFFDQSNWQALCNRCHSGPKRREDHADGVRQPRPGCTVDGMPLDPAHAWNAPGSG